MNLAWAAWESGVPLTGRRMGVINARSILGKASAGSSLASYLRDARKGTPWAPELGGGLGNGGGEDHGAQGGERQAAQPHEGHGRAAMRLR